MFRSCLLILAALMGVSAQDGSCASPHSVLPLGNTNFQNFHIGDTFSINYVGVADDETPTYFAFTVGEACEVDVKAATCGFSNGFNVTLRILESCDGSTLGSSTANCNEPNPDGTGFFGAEVGPVSVGKVTAPKTIIVEVTSPAAFSGEITIGGSVSGRNTGACGDPHFTRWTNEVRNSFHGECDMVLLKKENVEEGVDIDVQIRTTIKDSYSYIESAAVKIGNDAMEFQMDAVYLNGEKKDDSAFPIDLGNGNMITKVDPNLAKGRRFFHVTLLNRILLDIYSTKHFMGVKVGGNKEYLDGSFGMLGDYRTGDMIARDGRIMNNFEDFGFEWQVTPSDPKIFMDAREPQLPYERCRMPAVSAESRCRKLRGTDRELYEKAVEACTKNHIPANVQSCIDDVVFTGELDLAEH